VYSRLNGWAGDERAQHWYVKAERVMFTPREAAETFRSVYDVDLRSVLPTISYRRSCWREHSPTNGR
jgi:hypothetical protein